MMLALRRIRAVLSRSPRWGASSLAIMAARIDAAHTTGLLILGRGFLDWTEEDILAVAALRGIAEGTFRQFHRALEVFYHGAFLAGLFAYEHNPAQELRRGRGPVRRIYRDLVAPRRCRDGARRQGELGPVWPHAG